MRSSRLLLAAGMPLLVLAALLACSKKSQPPTAPPPSPACSISPTSLTFGSITVGAAADRQVTLTNSGSGTLSGTLSESCPEFSIVGTSAYSLGAGQAATFTVRFAPVSAGAKACTLVTGTPSCARLTCSGTGLAAVPQCQVAPSALNFNTAPFCPKTLKFLVTNVGTGTLAGAVSASCPDFSIEGDPAYSLSSGQSKEFAVRFAPTSLAGGTCDISVGNGLCPPLRTTGNVGVFLDTRGCILQPQSSTLDLGDVCVGETVTGRVGLSVLPGPDRGTITVGGGITCPDILEPDHSLWQAWVEPNQLPSGGGGALVNFSFTPTRAGDFGSLAVIHCGDTGPGGANYPRAYVTCTARAVMPPGCPACTVSPTSLDFGQVVVGQTKDLPIQITNTGTGILSRTAGPSHCSVFGFVGPTSYSLGAGQTATLIVRYIPSQVGQTTTCSLVPMGLGCDAVTFVGGAVAPPSCGLSTTLLDFATVPVGQTKDLTFDLQNVGGGTLCGTMSESCADFSIEVNPSYCITPPAFMRVRVRFSPTSTGFQQCTIAPGANCPQVTVRGTGG